MKLSTKNVDKMLELCTNKEINFMVYLAQLQDENGVVLGVRYDETMEKAILAKCTFYVSIYALEKKGLIELLESKDNTFWSIKIIDNVFKCDEDYSKGYINLNKKIFYLEKFKRMRKNIKKIVFHLFRINDFKKNTITVTRETLKKWTGATERSIRTYINMLAECFDVTLKGKLLYFSCLEGFETNEESEHDVKNKHIINSRLKKVKSQAKDKDITDVCRLIRQFYMYGIEKIIAAIDKSLSAFGTLAPAFINSAITRKNF